MKEPIRLNADRQGGVHPGDKVAVIASKAGLPGKVIGAIDLFDTYSFVEVTRAVALRVVQNSATPPSVAARSTPRSPGQSSG